MALTIEQDGCPADRVRGRGDLVVQHVEGGHAIHGAVNRQMRELVGSGGGVGGREQGFNGPS